MNTQTLQKWNKVRLDEIADFQYGYTASSKEDDTGTKLLRITDIVPDLIDWETVPFCDIDEKDAKQYGIKKGDILIARTGATAGYAKFIRRQPEKSVFASYLIRLTIKKADASSEYVGRIIESDTFKQFVASHASGSAQPHANAPILKDFEFLLPDLKTQVSVANILSVYDDLIYNNTRRIQILEQIAQATYTEWFVNFRFPGHEKNKMIDSRTDFGKIPEGWSIGKLSDLANITMGQSPSSDFYNESGDGSPFHQGVTNFDFRFPTTTTFSTGGTRRASAGDILFSVRAPVGRINVADRDMIIGRGLSAMRSVSESQSYLFYNLKNNFATEDLIGGGAIYASVTRADLSNFPLVIPDTSVIEKFESIVHPFDKLILNTSRELLILRSSRDLLLPKLVTGEITVK